MALPDAPRTMKEHEFIVIVREPIHPYGSLTTERIRTFDDFDSARSYAIEEATRAPAAEVGIYTVVQTWRAIAHVTIEEDVAT